MLRKIEGTYVESPLDDELVLLNTATGQFNALKTTGLAIWTLIDGTRDLDAIKDEVAQRFDVDRDQCGHDVEAFVDSLQKAGFVALA